MTYVPYTLAAIIPKAANFSAIRAGLVTMRNCFLDHQKLSPKQRSCLDEAGYFGHFMSLSASRFPERFDDVIHNAAHGILMLPSECDFEVVEGNTVYALSQELSHWLESLMYIVDAGITSPNCIVLINDEPTLIPTSGSESIRALAYVVCILAKDAHTKSNGYEFNPKLDAIAAKIHAWGLPMEGERF